MRSVLIVQISHLYVRIGKTHWSNAGFLRNSGILRLPAVPFSFLIQGFSLGISALTMIRKGSPNGCGIYQIYRLRDIKEGRTNGNLHCLNYQPNPFLTPAFSLGFAESSVFHISLVILLQFSFIRMILSLFQLPGSFLYFGQRNSRFHMIECRYWFFPSTPGLCIGH